MFGDAGRGNGAMGDEGKLPLNAPLPQAVIDRAPGPMRGSRPDWTLVWCIERLSESPLIPCNTFLEFLSTLDLEMLSPDGCPNLLKCRLVLTGLLNNNEITDDILRSLVGLMDMVSRMKYELDHRQYDIVTPPIELLVKVKTELVAQLWRQDPHVSMREVAKRVHSVFESNQLNEHEQTRYEELMHAASKDSFRESIDRLLMSPPTRQDVAEYAQRALRVIGPSTLSIIQADIEHGLYQPGMARSEMENPYLDGRRGYEQQPSMNLRGQRYPRMYREQYLGTPPMGHYGGQAPPMDKFTPPEGPTYPSPPLDMGSGEKAPSLGGDVLAQLRSALSEKKIEEILARTLPTSNPSAAAAAAVLAKVADGRRAVRFVRTRFLPE